MFGSPSSLPLYIDLIGALVSILSMRTEAADILCGIQTCCISVIPLAPAPVSAPAKGEAGLACMPGSGLLRTLWAERWSTDEVGSSVLELQSSKFTPANRMSLSSPSRGPLSST